MKLILGSMEKTVTKRFRFVRKRNQMQNDHNYCLDRVFGPIRAPWNRHHELYPTEPKNKSFDLNFDLFMVNLWSNFGQKKGYLTIKFEKIEKDYFDFVYSNKAHDGGFGELSWV